MNAVIRNGLRIGKFQKSAKETALSQIFLFFDNYARSADKKRSVLIRKIVF